jgi:hypothetical protein
MATAYTRIINFDGDVKDGARIDNFYADVSFASLPLTGPSKGHVFARETPNPDTAPNTVDVKTSDTPVGFDASIGFIEATFKLPQRFVSIKAKPYTVVEIDPIAPPPGRPFVRFFDANGNLIDEKHYPFFSNDPGWGSWQTIEMLAATKHHEIKTIIFSSLLSEPHVYSLFDTLIYANGNPDLQHVRPGPRL